MVLLNQESKFLIQKHESAKIEAQELEKQQENIENLKNKISTLEVKLPIYQDVKVNQEKLDNLDKNHQDTKNRLDNSVKELEKQKVSYNDLEKELAKLENIDEKQVELVNENNKLTRLSEKIDLVDHLDSEIESKKLQKYTDKKGVTRLSPIADWKHEEVLAVIHYFMGRRYSRRDKLRPYLHSTNADNSSRVSSFPNPAIRRCICILFPTQ